MTAMKPADCGDLTMGHTCPISTAGPVVAAERPSNSFEQRLVCGVRRSVSGDLRQATAVHLQARGRAIYSSGSGLGLDIR